MRERGTVHSIHQDVIVVEVKPVNEAACANCGLGEGCRQGTPHTLRVPFRGDVSVGDTVEIDVPMPSPAASALVLFVSPLVGLVAGYALGCAAYALVPDLGRTVALVAGAVAGLVAGFGVVVQVERRWRRRYPARAMVVRGD